MLVCVFLTKLQGMIKTWIKDGSPPFPCWSQLVEVVAASYGGQNPALAAELAKEHSTGELLNQSRRKVGCRDAIIVNTTRA